MAFGDDAFDSLLPSYLVEPDKGRLKTALKQFSDSENSGKQIDYSNFYRDSRESFFLQSDLLKEIRLATWEDESANYKKGYTDAIIISNSCDISPENSRDVNTKECLFAPLIDFNTYLLNLKKEAHYSSEKIESFKKNAKSQLLTNIFYLPCHPTEKKEYIVLLDNIFWFPTSELNSYISNIEENRITSLSQFGYYLFILKLSYHLCRLPEELDRD